jgi:hypothetical protein
MCGPEEPCRRTAWAEGEGEITAVPKNTNNLWTPEEDKPLKSLIESSKSMHLVAAELQRSVSAVKGRAHALKISIKRASFGLKAKGK